jgi:hypothetical protein
LGLAELLLLVVSRASAGCAVDADRVERQASAPLVVVGVVTALSVDERPGDGVVYASVAVERALKGRLERPGIVLQSGLPSTGCASAPVFAPGARVYAIGAPDDASVIVVSACQDDVGLVDRRPDLEAVARRNRGAARSFPGIDVPTLTPPGDDAIVTDDRRFWVVDEGATRAGVGVVGGGGDGHERMWVDFDGLQVLHDVPRSRLRQVVTVATPVVAGAALDWAPGVQVNAEGVAALPASWSVPWPVPVETLDVVWHPGEAEPSVGERLDAGAVVLFDRPGGVVLAEAAEGADLALYADGPTVDGWRAVRVSSAVVGGRAFVRDGSVWQMGASGGVVGGVVGGVIGGQVSLALPPGATVWGADGAVLARSSSGVYLPWLATEGGWAWLVVPTLDGPAVGRARCGPGDATACVIEGS